MINKRELSTKEDIVELVNLFYDKIHEDSELAPMFVGLDLDAHLLKMYDFWNSIIFTSCEYHGNPLKAHAELNEKFLLKEEHFKKWLELFYLTIDELYVGERAETMKKRAAMMANFLYSKIHNIEKVFA